MTRIKGSKALMEILIDEGVEYVFGNVGTTEVLFLDALQDYPSIKYILGLHENVVLAMANGYSRASDKVGFINVHHAAGLANTIGLLHNSCVGGVKLVVTAGQQDTRMLMQEPTLSADLVQMASQFTKWSVEIARATDIPLVMRRAFKVVEQPPTGPVFVSIPQDTLAEDIDIELKPLSAPYPRTRPDPEAISKAVELLSQAKAPAIIIGDGVGKSQSMAETVRIAEFMGAQVYDHGWGDVNFPNHHPLYRGTLDTNSLETREILQAFDVLLVVGCTLFRPLFYVPEPLITSSTKLIQVSDNPWEIGKNYPVDVGILANPKMALAELSNELEEKMSASSRETAAVRTKGVETEARERRGAWEKVDGENWDSVPITIGRLAIELRDLVEPGTIFVAEYETGAVVIRRNLNLTEPGTFMCIRKGGGALAWGLPAALGVNLARPDRPVVAVLGDGATLFSIQGLWTAAHYNIPVTFVVGNNSSYRVIKLGLLRLVGKARSSKFIGMDITDPPVDFVGIARGFGVHAQRVQNPQDLRPVLEEALHLGKPALVDVAVERSVD